MSPLDVKRPPTRLRRRLIVDDSRDARLARQADDRPDLFERLARSWNEEEAE
jgi:hypothetical protein